MKNNLFFNIASLFISPVVAFLIYVLLVGLDKEGTYILFLCMSYLPQVIHDTFIMIGKKKLDKDQKLWSVRFFGIDVMIAMLLSIVFAYLLLGLMPTGDWVKCMKCCVVPVVVVPVVIAKIVFLLSVKMFGLLDKYVSK